jgi:Protein of unknown function (DUF1800)
VPPVPVYGGRFGTREAERLLWRAGFGPRPGEARELASRGLERAVHSLTRPPREALHGPPPADPHGDPLAPRSVPGHDVLWWVDRMARSNQPLVGRMALIWQDCFAVGHRGPQGVRVAQKAALRRRALGSFEELLRVVRRDPSVRRDPALPRVDPQDHATRIVERLWGYFIPTQPGDRTKGGLERVYTSCDRRIGPLVEAILMHPDLYEGEAMVKPPVVFIVGMLRARGRGIDESSSPWVLEVAGEGLLDPPNLRAWDESRWLESPALRGRWTAVASTVGPDTAEPSDGVGVQGPRVAVDRALRYWGAPRITRATRWELEDFAQRVENAIGASEDADTYRVLRQRALRVLVATAPDMEAC